MVEKIIEKNREDHAVFYNTQVLESINQIRVKTMILAASFCEIKDKEYYIDLGYETFQQYCCSPEISLLPTTAEKYIRTYKYLVIENKIDVDKIKNIAIGKLNLLRQVKKPAEWLKDAEVLAYSDLRKNISEKEKGVEIKGDDFGNYNKKSEPVGCPNWSAKEKKCLLEKFE